MYMQSTQNDTESLRQIIVRQRAERSLQRAIDRGAADIESVLEREFFRSYRMQIP
jgi:hypothetical protein